jgi:hypothetical protein
MTTPDVPLDSSAKRKNRPDEILPEAKRAKKENPEGTAGNAPATPLASRVRKQQAVPQLPEVDTGFAEFVKSPAVRADVTLQITDLVQDLKGAELDTGWAEYLEQTGNDIEQKFFGSGTALPTPGTLGSLGDDDPWKPTHQEVSATLKNVGLGPAGKGTGPVDHPTGEGLFQASPYQKGQWKADGETSVVEGPRNYTSTYDILLAHAISQSVINYLKAKKVEITEIQVMVLDDRIMVSSNETKIIAELKDAKLAQVFGEPPSTEPGWARESQQVATDLRRLVTAKENQQEKDFLVRAAAAANLHDEQAGALTTMLTSLQGNERFTLIPAAKAKETKLQRQQALASYVTDKAGKGKIILVDSAPVCHAEQNLLVALALSRYKGNSATIAGGKRPCTVCHVAFRLVQKYKYANIRFVQGHGGFWYDSSKGSFAALAKALELSEKIVEDEARVVLALAQYVTSKHRGAPEMAEITDIRARVLGQTVDTDHIPGEIAVPPEIVRGLQTYEPEPAELQAASKEENSYEISQSLEEIRDSQFEDLERPPPGWNPDTEMEMETDPSEAN